tara:strand:- start:796 stop:1536 length:741 start_codon:yes stop_codon:yes gene_type:complete
MMRICTEKATGTRIFRTLPRGLDPSFDIQDAFPSHKITTIFDIGANIGQSAKEFRENYPDSNIYCFEPVPSTFEALKKNIAADPKAKAFQIGFGQENSKAQMVSKEASDQSYLVEEGEDTKDQKIVEVDIFTLTHFCEKENIDHIDFLKIDTEGRDLDVLKGACDLLKAQKIDIVELEAGMYPGNNRHVPFEILKSYMEEQGYLLFGIYEQVHEWTTKSPNLRRVNPVYVSKALIDKYQNNSQRAA